MRQAAMAAALALLAAACSGQSNSTSSGSTSTNAPMTSATNPPGAGSGSVTVKIMAQNGSGETGSATLTPMGSKTRVVIGLKGEPLTGDQPAHIHKGSCANLDPKPAYPLKNVVLGKSNTVVDVSLDTLTSSPMAINVHLSTKALKHYVACGDISPTSP